METREGGAVVVVVVVVVVAEVTRVHGPMAAEVTRIERCPVKHPCCLGARRPGWKLRASPLAARPPATPRCLRGASVGGRTA